MHVKIKPWHSIDKCTDASWTGLRACGSHLAEAYKAVPCRLGLSSSPQEPSQQWSAQLPALSSSRAASLTPPPPLHQPPNHHQRPQPQAPTGVRFTSQPQLSHWESCAEAGISVQSSEASQPSLPRPVAGETFSNPLYSAQHTQPGHRSMAALRPPDQASASSEYYPQAIDFGPDDTAPSSLPHRRNDQSLPSQSSTVDVDHSQAVLSQSVTSQLATGAQVMPSQTSITNPRMPHSSSVQFSSAPLLGPSTTGASQQLQGGLGLGSSRASQQAQHTLASGASSTSQQAQFGQGALQAGTSNASQQAQQLQATEGEGASGRQQEEQQSSSRQTQDSDAGPSSNPQVTYLPAMHCRPWDCMHDDTHA